MAESGVSLRPEGQTKQTESSEESKDFVEHLRTVHFALVITCIALFVVLTTPSQANISKAEDDLRIINEIVTTWDRMLMATAVTHTTSDFIGQCKTNFADAYVYDGKRVYALKFDQNRILKESGATWRFLETYFDGLEDSPSIVGTHHPPLSLKEFRQLWDSSFSLLCPEYLSDHVRVSYANHAKSYELLYVAPHVPPNTPSVQVNLGASMQTARKRSTGEEIPTFVGGYNDIGGDRFIDIEIPASNWISTNVRWRNEIIKAVPANHLRHADFDAAFPELAQVTKDVQDVTFDDLGKLLALEKNHAKPSFEAFGIRFPAEGTARWGIPLLLGMQLYFFLHFRQYRRRKSKPVAIAWIGNYDDSISRLAFQATALALPTSTVAFVAFNTTLVDTPKWNVYLLILGIALSALFATLTRVEYDPRISLWQLIKISLFLVLFAGAILIITKFISSFF